MKSIGKSILEIFLIVITWIMIPYKQLSIIECVSNWIPDNLITPFFYSSGDLIIYAICLISTLTIFIAFHGFKKSLLLEIQLKKTTINNCAIFLALYIILILVALVSDGLNLELKYIIMTFITQFIFVAFIEELSFRKILIFIIEKITNNSIVVVITNTVVFTGVHIIGYMISFSSINDINLNILIIKIVYLLIIGAVLATIYLYERNILLCVLVHGSQNVLAQLIYIDEIKGLILYFVGLFVVCSFVIIQGHMKARKNEFNI